MLGQCMVNYETGIECYNDSSIPFPRKTKRKFTVAVEGNIGSGKSTFLEFFKEYKCVEVLPEPVEMWKSVRGYNTLDLMYKDACRWSLTFQSYVQLTMLMNHTRKQIKPIKLMERSLFSAKYCFVENLYKGGSMPGVDYAVLSEWFDWIVNNGDVAVDQIIYLQASPETCMERIKMRNRSEESSVPLEYLQSLHTLHEDWLIHEKVHKAPAPVVTINCDKSLEDLRQDFERLRPDILCGF